MKPISMLSDLGRTVHDAGRIDEAIAACRRVLELEPGQFEALNHLGFLLYLRGRLDEAIAVLEAATRFHPGSAPARNNLGIVLMKAGRAGAAVAAFDCAVAIAPDDASAYNNLGNTLWMVGAIDRARAAIDRAVALRPDYADAYNNLGNILRDQGQLDAALRAFRMAVAIRPEFVAAASNFLFNLHAHPGYDAQALLAEHRRWAARYAAPLAAEIRPHPNDRTPDRRLRVGYVSPDFRAHAVGRLLPPLFAGHDRHQFEIVAYSDLRTPDALTARLRSLVTVWRDTAGLSDPELAEQIRADGIDILVDLAMHTANNRLLVFARKPAPVQVTMLGLASTSGLDTIDYRLTDRYIDPPETGDGDYSERSIRLPHCLWCCEPAEEAPAVGTLPALENGFVTFGSLNQLGKASGPALDAWAEILRSVPGSHLVLHAHAGQHRESIRQRFLAAGVTPGRIDFVPRLARASYLQTYNRLDIGLDPFPQNGGVTTLDALWMGVPVVTLAGRTAVGRAGRSILSNLGLPELIAATPAEYVAIAVARASDPERLAALRSGLRARMRSSALTAGQQYAADIEAAFRAMWHDWCARA
jgi:predicted O-linked N-acetylglucosamine transferase (SPINDLY family)